MPSNSAAQTAQAQQGNQLQAEQFLASQRQLAEQQWSDFFSNNPNPASTWGGIAAPNFSGAPAQIGGGTINGRGQLRNAFPGWMPSPPGGTPLMPAPPPSNPPSKNPPPSSGPPPKTPPGSGEGGGGGHSGGGTPHQPYARSR